MNYIEQLLQKVNNGEITEDEMCKRLTRKYKNKIVLDLITDSPDDFYIEEIFPSDSDKNVKDLLYDFMSSHTYDNGLPLTGLNYPPDNPDEEHDYFEHYDRDQDLEIVSGLEDEIKKIVYDEKYNVFNVIVNVTVEEYESSWYETYQGSSYEHDFG